MSHKYSLNNVNLYSSEGSYAVYSALGSKTLCFAILISLILCLGCDPEEKHRILTTFFDGVPPLYEEITSVTDPNAIGSDERAELTWYIHEPQKDCAVCHGEKKERTFSAAVQLTSKVPELCFQCHEDQRSFQERYVHGPVAVAQCLLCHDPHKSTNKHVLKYPVPEVCYGCHTIEWTNMIDDHELQEYKNCLDCHSGHASNHKYLLVPDWDKKGN